MRVVDAAPGIGLFVGLKYFYDAKSGWNKILFSSRGRIGYFSSVSFWQRAVSGKELGKSCNWTRVSKKKKFTQSDMEENVLHNNVMKFKLWFNSN